MAATRISTRKVIAILFVLYFSGTLCLADSKNQSINPDELPPPKDIVSNMGSYNTREERFPSIEQRVKVYTSNWYTPPCDDYEEGFLRYQWNGDDDSWPSLQVHQLVHHPLVNASVPILDIESIVEPDMLFLLDPEIMVHCANYSYDEDVEDVEQDPVAQRIKFRQNMRMYCVDVQDLMLPALAHVQLEKQNTKMPPTLLQFGDNKQSHVHGDVMVPHIKKFRSAVNQSEDLDAVTKDGCLKKTRPTLDTAHGNERFQPLVWKLATDRHYRHLYEVYRADTVWSKKMNMAVFRGQLTGSREGYDKTLSDEENCYNLKRCRLVYNHANSTLIDASLTSTRGRLPDILNGVTLVGDKVRLNYLLQFKGIIMIEGNDVASGLKWALLSQSVVLMPPPKHTSWAMEELLQPWVHYIPLDDFATNVEERMQWIVDHDEEARRISERASLWMEDLIFHPDAAEDDRLIQEEILRRYQSHFREQKR
ncbi:glycosyl transferase family 90 protein [Nitzschia inconspicua]|uniref:Glycosyl transferase family 90 protein n=1 Tax=Nitzschia inconspicua TaxID=303405 RepID=A0A9K3L657_9STRA|nr:glycosyl transferase family 90 protein [Nitzschia inconspicua]